MTNMTKDTLLQLEQDMKNAIFLVLARYHKQDKGIRIANLQVQKEQLNPPGVSYSIKMNAQVTFPTDVPQIETPPE